MKDVIVIGGGLAGLVTAIQLVKRDIPVTIIEKDEYPRHRVCGEYVSNEVVPFLQKSLSIDCDGFPSIRKFQLTSASGRSVNLPLDLGGFGISRFTFDDLLFRQARALGVRFMLNTSVTDVSFRNECFWIKTDQKELQSDLVVGSYGKRSKLDKRLDRAFTKKRSPFMAVKYHIKTDHPDDLIALHNFRGGYCGVSKVENGVTNLCYLVHRDMVKQSATLENLENNILMKNPLLKYIFSNSEFLYKKPLTINEVSFATKGPVENHILMGGDAAGMIVPLCGNGMAMAIRSGKLLSECIAQHFHTIGRSRHILEMQYSGLWEKNFRRRLWVGRQMQKLFGSLLSSSIAVNLAVYMRPITDALVRQSHGAPF